MVGAQILLTSANCVRGQFDILHPFRIAVSKLRSSPESPFEVELVCMWKLGKVWRPWFLSSVWVVTNSKIRPSFGSLSKPHHTRPKHGQRYIDGLVKVMRNMDGRLRTLAKVDKR